MATPAKKQRLNAKGKSFFVKQTQKTPRNFLKCGDDGGFLVTYNFKEKESVREVYKLLNEYYQQSVETEKTLRNSDDDDDDDITIQLNSEIEKSKQETQTKSNLFQSLDTGTNGCIFIKTSLPNYHDIGVGIIRDLFATKSKKTKFTNRFIPIDKVCKAKIEEIVSASGELFDQHFIKEPSTFAINFNKRYNNDIKRDEVIKQLAELVSQKNIKNKVDLKNPAKTILVEIMKGLCLISVIPDYLKLRKYNLNELSASGKNDDVEKKNDVEEN